MANCGYVYQQTHNVSIPKEDLLDFIVYNKELSKKDLRVVIFLLTELDGWKEPKRGRRNDPMNFKVIDKEVIAERLYMKEKEVKESLKNLLKYDIIERGDSVGSANGYRFTF